MLVTLIATGRFADPVDYFGPNLPANQVLLYTPGNGANGNDPLRTKPGPASAGAPSPARLNSCRRRRRGLAGQPRHPRPRGGTDAFVGRLSGSAIRGGPGTVYVATPALLAHYGIDPSAIDPDDTAAHLARRVCKAPPGSG